MGHWVLITEQMGIISWGGRFLPPGTTPQIYLMSFLKSLFLFLFWVGILFSTNYKIWKGKQGKVSLIPPSPGTPPQAGRVTSRFCFLPEIHSVLWICKHVYIKEFFLFRQICSFSCIAAHKYEKAFVKLIKSGAQWLAHACTHTCSTPSVNTAMQINEIPPENHQND